jgi:hypothetical protein
MIKYFTARGSVSGIDWTDFTTSQLEHWGAKYHELIMNRKPHYDLLIDDKAVNALKWRAALDPQKRANCWLVRSDSSRIYKNVPRCKDCL